MLVLYPHIKTISEDLKEFEYIQRKPTTHYFVKGIHKAKVLKSLLIKSHVTYPPTTRNIKLDDWYSIGSCCAQEEEAFAKKHISCQLFHVATWHFYLFSINLFCENRFDQIWLLCQLY